MNWFKKSKTIELDKKEMYDWFEKRTNKHIELVRKYCKKIADYDNKFEGLIERGKIHDQSKFESPEYEPYVYISWKYKCKDDGEEFEAPENMEDRMDEATEHHVNNKSNKHHPESHSEQKGCINKKDRDKPPENAIDATKMSDLDIGEMMADWLSMSEEKGTSPKKWADDNVDKRWKFTKEHKDLIYELIENIYDKG